MEFIVQVSQKVAPLCAVTLLIRPMFKSGSPRTKPLQGTYGYRFGIEMPLSLRFGKVPTTLQKQSYSTTSCKVAEYQMSNISINRNCTEADSVALNDAKMKTAALIQYYNMVQRTKQPISLRDLHVLFSCCSLRCRSPSFSISVSGPFLPRETCESGGDLPHDSLWQCSRARQEPQLQNFVFTVVYECRLCPLQYIYVKYVNQQNPILHKAQLSEGSSNLQSITPPPVFANNYSCHYDRRY